MTAAYTNDCESEKNDGTELDSMLKIVKPLKKEGFCRKSVREGDF